MTSLETFINNLLTILKDLKIDVSNLELDHYAYQASSAEDYNQMKANPINNAVFFHEGIVDNRRVGMFKFPKQIEILDYKISGYEIIEPKEGQVTENRFDHVEFVTDRSLHDFVAAYPEIDWDLKAIDRDEFAKVALRFENGTSVKFHAKNVFEEIL